jgi:hypothetical protein
MTQKLIVEVNSKIIKEEPLRDGKVLILITPPLNSEFWSYRVRLFEDQAIIAFPKFMTIGIGFAVEEVDWNTNLPWTSEAEDIWEHIKVNKKHRYINKVLGVRAIKLIQNK